jgi:hypothetical protein
MGIIDLIHYVVDLEGWSEWSILWKIKITTKKVAELHEKYEAGIAVPELKLVLTYFVHGSNVLQ